MRLLLLMFATSLLTGPLPLAAQDEELTSPPTWRVRLDRSTASMDDLYYVDMPPGWHVTTGPAAILYDPARVGEGTFTIDAEIFQFPTTRVREAYGIIFGGRDLEGDGQAYVYFLIRGDGRFLVKRRAGSATETLVPWTAHEVIVPRGPGEENIKNTLRVVAGGDTVSFFVNGTEVGSVPRAGLECDGIVGLRVNHSVNLHVTNLDVTQ